MYIELSGYGVTFNKRQTGFNPFAGWVCYAKDPPF